MIRTEFIDICRLGMAPAWRSIFLTWERLISLRFIKIIIKIELYLEEIWLGLGLYKIWHFWEDSQ